MPSKRFRSKSGSSEELGWEKLDDKEGLESKEVSSEKESDCYTAEKLSSKPSPKSTSKLVTPKRKIPKNSPPSTSQIKSRGHKRFKRLRRALSFSRSKSTVDMNEEPEKTLDSVGHLKSSRKPALIALPAPTLQGKKDTLPRSPHISPHPEATGSGRSSERRKLDLLSKEIEELEIKFRKPGPQVGIGYRCSCPTLPTWLVPISWFIIIKEAGVSKQCFPGFLLSCFGMF